MKMVNRENRIQIRQKMDYTGRPHNQLFPFDNYRRLVKAA